MLIFLASNSALNLSELFRQEAIGFRNYFYFTSHTTSIKLLLRFVHEICIQFQKVIKLCFIEFILLQGLNSVMFTQMN
jgi:hypothetical protein